MENNNQENKGNNNNKNENESKFNAYWIYGVVALFLVGLQFLPIADTGRHFDDALVLIIAQGYQRMHHARFSGARTSCHEECDDRDQPSHVSMNDRGAHA